MAVIDRFHCILHVLDQFLMCLQLSFYIASCVAYNCNLCYACTLSLTSPLKTLCSGYVLFSDPCHTVSSQGYRVWWMQDYQFRDPVVIVKCQAYTGAVAATVKDQGVCIDNRGIVCGAHLLYCISAS